MRYLKDYASEWAQLGEAKFRLIYGRPALIMLGMLGELADRAASHAGRTLVSKLPTDKALIEMEALRNRVWLIAPQAGSRAAVVSLGRAKGNDVVIPEYSVSDQHCEFRNLSGQCAIVDLQSYNGTIVNEQRLEPNQPCPLKDWDTIALGRYQFSFLTGEGFVQAVATYRPR